jgi:hypothetical protein
MGFGYKTDEIFQSKAVRYKILLWRQREVKPQAPSEMTLIVICMSIQTAITKYHRLGGLNKRHFSHIVLEP